MGLIREMLCQPHPKINIVERQYPRRILGCIDGVVNAESSYRTTFLLRVSTENEIMSVDLPASELD
jgi:hypothetical protein